MGVESCSHRRQRALSCLHPCRRAMRRLDELMSQLERAANVVGDTMLAGGWVPVVAAPGRVAARWHGPRLGAGACASVYL